jgi:hypothetical protein
LRCLPHVPNNCGWGCWAACQNPPRCHKTSALATLLGTTTAQTRTPSSSPGWPSSGPPSHTCCQTHPGPQSGRATGTGTGLRASMHQPALQFIYHGANTCLTTTSRPILGTASPQLFGWVPRLCSMWYAGCFHEPAAICLAGSWADSLTYQHPGNKPEGGCIPRGTYDHVHCLLVVLQRQHCRQQTPSTCEAC